MKTAKSRLRNLVILLLVSSIFLSAGSTFQAPDPPGHDVTQYSRTIQFAGVTWGIRNGWGSPGPNEFSDSTESVWVDSAGRLHLKIRKEGDTWYSAEVFSLSRARYGPHTFQVISVEPELDDIDPNIVFGMFLYKSGCAVDCHDELDVEISRWRNPGWFYNALFAAQPASTLGNRHRFHLSLEEPLSTYLIDWQKNRVDYASYVGGSVNLPVNLLDSWRYTGADIPSVSEDVRVIIDLWMDGGSEPYYGQEYEVIVADAGISTVCFPVQEVGCGDTLIGRTDEPGSRDQVDRYANWPWPEFGPEVAYKFTSPITGTVSLLLSENPENQDILVLDGSAGKCSSYNTTISGGNEVTSFDAALDHEYYFLVDSMLEEGGRYRLDVDCSGNLPPEDPPRFKNFLFLPAVRR